MDSVRFRENGADIIEFFVASGESCGQVLVGGKGRKATQRKPVQTCELRVEIEG